MLSGRLKLIAGAALLGVAALMLYRSWTAPASRPSAGTAASSRLRMLETPAPPAPRGRGIALEAAADPALRLDLLARVRAVKYEGTERNIFQFYTPAPAPLPKPVVNPVQPEQAPPKAPPPPPPIPLKFYGFSNRPGDPVKKAFLTDGEDIVIAGQGEVVKRRYKILHIGVNTIEIEDLETKNKQKLPLEEP